MVENVVWNTDWSVAVTRTSCDYAVAFVSAERKEVVRPSGTVTVSSTRVTAIKPQQCQQRQTTRQLHFQGLHSLLQISGGALVRTRRTVLVLEMRLGLAICLEIKINGICGYSAP